MNLKRIVHVTGVGLSALVVVTFIYGAIESRIANIRNQKELDQYLQENKLAVIEFYNPTCPVCNAFKKAGIFQQLADALPHVGFAMVSFEDAKPLHHTFKIEAFPTFIFFSQGKELRRYEGYVGTGAFKDKINQAFTDKSQLPIEQ
jgi:thiol-disulfide isomerase/thioredoxin